MKNLTNLHYLKNAFVFLFFLLLNYSLFSKSISFKTDNIYSLNCLDGMEVNSIEWPRSWDGLPDNNPMLECSSGFNLDEQGHPHPSKTGYPLILNDTCGNISIDYQDISVAVICGTTIFRTWVVDNGCTGEKQTYVQLIRITDTTAPTFTVQEDLVYNTSAYSCSLNLEVPNIKHLNDMCDSDPKWWITSEDRMIVGDTNNNGFVDSDEIWIVLNLQLGENSICYHSIDNCGNVTSKCTKVTVLDNTRPIPVCVKQKIVNIISEPIVKLQSSSFDAGSFDNCNPVYFKVMRVNDDLEYDNGCLDLNGDDNPDTDEIEVWFDDDVFFCSEDNGKVIMTRLRVFDIDPGYGAVNSERMEVGGDLFNHYNDCWTMVTISEDTIDNIAPIPALVDNATVIMNEDFSFIKAIIFDKSFYPLASSDNLTPGDELIFTFSENIPKLWETQQGWEQQFQSYGKYFFDPNTGDMKTESEFLNGQADAWLPSQRTTQRVLLCNVNTQSVIKVYVWDQFAYNTSIDYNNYAFSEVEMKYKNCGIGILGIDKTIAKTKLYQNAPNPFSENTIIRFDLPSNSEYKLSIFDFNGSLVFSRESLGKEGMNSIEVESDKFLKGAGIFFYKLESEKFIEIKKMVKL